jgi:hypothetical protein
MVMCEQFSLSVSECVCHTHIYSDKKKPLYWGLMLTLVVVYHILYLNSLDSLIISHIGDSFGS